MITTVTPFPLGQAPDEIQIMNRWIFKTIWPYIKGRTLEINSGTNSLCQLFTNYNRPIHLSDTNQLYIQTLQEAYRSNHLIRAVHDFNLMSADFQRSQPGTLNVFDTVITLSTSIQEFEQMADNIRYILPQEGTLILILPAHTSIYHGLDQNLNDWKRYNRKYLERIRLANFSILKVNYFNLATDIAKGFFPNSGLSALIIVQKN